MNEKPLKKLTINNSPYQIILVVDALIFPVLLSIIIYINEPQFELPFLIIFCSSVLSFPIIACFWLAYKVCKAKKYYVSDILIKNDSFDIVYKKGVKTAWVHNIKISDIKDLKLEVDFIASDRVKFCGSIYPKEGTEVIKFTSGYSLFTDKFNIPVFYKYLYCIIKYFRVFDFFHLEFLNEGEYTRKELEYFLVYGEKSPESKKEAIKSLGQGIIFFLVLSLAGFLLSVCIVFFMLRPDLGSLFGKI